MIEAAAALVHRNGADAELLRLSVEMEWALGSGAAHGRLLMKLHRMGGYRLESGTALMGASAQEVVMQISGVSLVLNEAWRRWDQRRVSR